MAAIEANELVKTYPGGVRALDGLTFDVPEGTVFGLLGPNGAGKTTAVKILTTLAAADSGNANVAGYDVRRDAARVRRAIGVVSQRHGVDVALTGGENLRLQGRIFGMERGDIESRAEELLDQLGLGEAADRVTRGYSGGMQRRLDIAMALVHRPQVLFLDEPTTGLDPEVRAAMWQEIARLARREGLTILLTTHYLEEAYQLAANLAIVDKGKVVAAGMPDSLKGECAATRCTSSSRPPRTGVRATLWRVSPTSTTSRSTAGASARASRTGHVQFPSCCRRSKPRGSALPR